MQAGALLKPIGLPDPTRVLAPHSRGEGPSETDQKLSTVCTNGDQISTSPFDAPSLSEHVRNYLLQEMTSGVLRPGDRINEAQFARTLGISRNPIREAIAGLARQGYLEALPRRGHRMRLMTARDIDDVFSFRIMLETYAVELALPQLTPRSIARLRAIQNRMTRAARQDNVTDVREADIALHRAICEQSGNRRLLRAHEAIDIEIRMLIACVDLQREPLQATALAHVPIVEAFAARDLARSVAAMHHHLETTWAAVHDLYRLAAARGQAAGGHG